MQGKTKKPDVVAFSKSYHKELYRLYDQLRRRTYRHGSYERFYIHDPKLRMINKACVRDRVLHHAIFRRLYPIFDRAFIFDSYSCRDGKGTHRGVLRLQEFLRKESRNNSRQCWALKCDVKKFFDGIDHGILLSLLGHRIKDVGVIGLLEIIIHSFEQGLPLGNITSQLFANVYLHELDMFMKHTLQVKYYLRYCDDFVIVNTDRQYLEGLIPKIELFLQQRLVLKLHPGKIIFRTWRQGIDFLGYVVFPRHIVLRPKTKRRMLRIISLKYSRFKAGLLKKEVFEATIQSYLGVLKHCNSWKIRKLIEQIVK